MKKKVLIVVYYWPPAGGPGVQRWLKFVKYLPDFDIEPIVYCPENPHYPITDTSLIDDVPKGITIIKKPIKEPYQLASFFSSKSTKTISSGIIPKQKKQSFIQRLLLYVRGNFFIPDARKKWVKPSVDFLSTYIKDNAIDTVITTGPPHSLHLIGLQLKAKNKINWLADFRDPWTTIGYHKDLKLTKSSKAKHKQLEHDVLNTANHIIVTSNHTKNEFSQKTEKPITVVTNGYDIALNTTNIEKDTSFTVSHIGSLLSQRNPTVLWEVISELIKGNTDFAESFKLNLVGVVSDDVYQSICSYGLKDWVNLVGYVSHDVAIQYQQKSQLLLLIEIDSEDTKAIIPGKVFEYVTSKTPIFSIGPKDSDIEQIILSTQTGVYFTYSDKIKMKKQILTYFDAYTKQELSVSPVDIEKYSRKALTEQLVSLIL